MLTYFSIFSGMTELPFWPGVPADKLIGKSFEINAQDVHIIDENGLIKRSWHIEDYAQVEKIH